MGQYDLVFFPYRVCEWGVKRETEVDRHIVYIYESTLVDDIYASDKNCVFVK